MGSTRFHGKPLVNIAGISMIERVYRQAQKATELNEIVVATDDSLIYNAVQAFGGNVVLTGSDHLNGTSRCLEAYGNFNSTADLIINIQGDEPFIDPSSINALSVILKTNEAAQIATLVKAIVSLEQLQNSNIPKVVLDEKQKALYFSRNPIPFIHGVDRAQWLQKHTFYKHIGIYGFRANVLPNLVNLKASPLETAENLEQLRWLEHGYGIYCGLTLTESLAIDTPQDLEKALQWLQDSKI
jgi:3-deoxy-manno-octulosonate cytidylyltransferase (CMP-KDO synthetase)